MEKRKATIIFDDEEPTNETTKTGEATVIASFLMNFNDCREHFCTSWFNYLVLVFIKKYIFIFNTEHKFYIIIYRVQKFSRPLKMML